MLDQIIARLTRMVSFDHTVYREIAQDDDATLQAAAIIVVAAVASAIGSAIIARSFWAFLYTLFIQVPLGWLIWSGLVYLVGTKLFTGQGTFMGVLRVLGYTTAPAVLGLLVVIPCLGWIASLVGAVLSLVLGFFAIRETLELTSEKAVLTIVIGWVLRLVIGMIGI
jgi:hypothetical protein